MSIKTKKYHDESTKCAGYGKCPDCTERINNQKATRLPPLDLKILEDSLKQTTQADYEFSKKINEERLKPLATMKPECCTCYRQENLYQRCSCGCHQLY